MNKIEDRTPATFGKKNLRFRKVSTVFPPLAFYILILASELPT